MIPLWIDAVQGTVHATQSIHFFFFENNKLLTVQKETFKWFIRRSLSKKKHSVVSKATIGPWILFIQICLFTRITFCFDINFGKMMQGTHFFSIDFECNSGVFKPYF